MASSLRRSVTFPIWLAPFQGTSGLARGLPLALAVLPPIRGVDRKFERADDLGGSRYPGGAGDIGAACFPARTGARGAGAGGVGGRHLCGRLDAAAGAPTISAMAR